ncbi:SWIM zinc finger family protein [Iodobacter fluviatilis]|uniref:SWIM-type domain-containing protein n=1 Tax=Iodobacter fluviatilis TaxID=537 RepID=A0A7G3GFL9_9NEIS|nr:SWIM zinc finger family protein [Iodobacter fluviatilis]QBC45922.1 hypothetical protein C1H71_20500 [Iodobacter fluviatilis]
MNALRPDLLALSSEALIALSNAGFVKKAQKDLSEGKSPELNSENGELIARYSDGHISTLPAGAGLRDARCTCPANGLCRHRVTMVLAYQHQASMANEAENEPTASSHEAAVETWSPALFKTELETLPSSLLKRAYRLASANTLIRLTAWQSDSPTPTAHLPMCSVRFFSSHSLSHARCDCSDQQVCEHIALAVMAFAQAPTENWTQLNVTVIPPQQNATAYDLFSSEAAMALDQAIQTIALQLWQEGSSQPLHHLEALFAQALQLAESLKWRWVLESLTALRQALLDQAARSSRAHPERTLALLCELQARWTSSRYACQPDAPSTPPLLPTCWVLASKVKSRWIIYD